MPKHKKELHSLLPLFTEQIKKNMEYYDSIQSSSDKKIKSKLLFEYETGQKVSREICNRIGVLLDLIIKDLK